ncbi:MAG TPA: hypothetical protein VFA10_09060, partial [Ktedonobacteraceae bacterium]|nr:hypothetical protein [Ktedonobacteraceae bacterium]
MQTQPDEPSHFVLPMADPSVPRIYVCYAPERDGRTATHIKEDLRAAGAQILEDLERSEWILFLQTPTALQSPTVEAVMSRALILLQHWKIKGIFRFVVHPLPSDSLPPDWSRLQAFDATQDYDAALEELLEALRYLNSLHPSDEQYAESSLLSSAASDPVIAPSMMKATSSQEKQKPHRPFPSEGAVVSRPARPREMLIGGLRARPWFVATVLSLTLLIVIGLGWV